MIGKKKSGFQITSVTSDYDGGSGEGLKETLNGEAEIGGPFATPLVNGGPSYGPGGHPPVPSPADLAGTGKDGPAADRTKLSSAMEAVSAPAGGEEVPPRGAGLACDASAGPVEPPGQPRAVQEALAADGAALAPQPNDAAPPGISPGAKTPLKTPCPPTPASGSHHPGGSCSSRFRVVKLDHGLGEPYRRGRWTCVDLYDKDLDSHVLAKVLDGARHVNSLDSHLEISSFAHKAINQLRPKLHVPKSQGSPPIPCQGDAARGKAAAAGGTLNMLIQAAKTLSLEGPALAASEHQQHPCQPGTPAPASPPWATPHLPAGRGNVGAAASVPSVSVTVMPKETLVSKSDSSLLTATAKEEPKAGPVQLQGAKAAAGEQSVSKQRTTNVSQPSSGEQGGVRKFSEPRSTSTSPAPLAQDSSPSRKTRASEPVAASSLHFVSPMQTLAKSMLSVGTHQDGDDDSGSSSSMVAIDNKIEQAMDLVKSHLMYAVREEVEVLKEQIKELIDRNSLLERENALLKSLANPDQLSQLQAQLRSAGSSVGSSGSLPASTSTA
ncbi:TSC22 domain family protein 4-like [Heterodontus francisci]|uniref:TSC22 domain family protein 4-like n=1 Tax=Heterodontus francisci TaxID=7792 RepID=UPI00355AE4D1